MANHFVLVAIGLMVVSNSLLSKFLFYKNGGTILAIAFALLAAFSAGTASFTSGGVDIITFVVAIVAAFVGCLAIKAVDIRDKMAYNLFSGLFYILATTTLFA